MTSVVEIAPITYKTQAVRDLAWACFSPPLLDVTQLPDAAADIGACRFELTSRRQQWLQQLDDDPSALLAHLSEGAHSRLGLYFESLWHFFLQQDFGTELLANNLPVRVQGRTLGEFDILYYDRERERHCHLELAVKYFLGHAQSSAAPPQWLGPDSRDRLDLKLAHMLHQQIQLSALPGAQPELEKLGIGTPDKQIALRGYLFTQAGTGMAFPSDSVPPGNRGTWVSRIGLAAHIEHDTAEQFLVLPRLRWLSPAMATQSDERLSAAELPGAVDDYWTQRAAPLLIAALSGEGREMGRFFLVPDNWPQSIAR